jgi:hypothetical protein
MSAPALSPERLARITDLRDKIGIKGLRRTPPPQLTSGLPGLDARAGGWPRRAISALYGPPGSGRLSLLLPALSALTAQRQTVAIVDSEGWLYPPGLEGVDLDHLLLLRPRPAEALWTAEQLARCPALALVALLDPPPSGRSARRLLRAVEDGGGALVVLRARPDPDLPLSLRVDVDGSGWIWAHRRGAGEPLRLPAPREERGGWGTGAQPP